MAFIFKLGREKSIFLILFFNKEITFDLLKVGRLVDPGTIDSKFCLSSQKFRGKPRTLVQILKKKI